MKLLVLDPIWGITDNCLPSRDTIQQFIHAVIEDVKTNSVKLLTIKMQFYFGCQLATITEQIDNHRATLLKRLAPLEINICKTLEPKEQDEFSLLNKKFVYYITLITGLGSPANQKVKYNFRLVKNVITIC